MDTRNSTDIAKSESSNDPLALQDLLDRATSHIEQNQFEEAKPLLDQAIARQPRSLEVRMLVAVLYARIGQAETAEEQLRAALRIKPDNPDALHNLAVLLISRGKLEEAKRHLHKLLLLNDKNVDVYNDLAIIEAETENFTGAERAFSTGIDLPGANKKIFVNYLEYCIKSGNRDAFDKAVEKYRSHWNSAPTIKWPDGSGLDDNAESNRVTQPEMKQRG